MRVKLTEEKRGISFWLMWIVLCSVMVFAYTSFVSAVPPVTTTQQFSEGFSIQIPQDNILEQNKNYTFEFHIINVSNGMPIISEVNCSFHLYDVNGIHQFEGYDDTVSSSLDYSFYVSDSNFSRLGAMYYFIGCNSSVLGGVAESIVRVTPTGEEIGTPMTLIYSLFIGILIFLFILNIVAIPLLPSEDNKDDEGALISVNQLKYLRPILYLTGWILLISIVFSSANIGNVYFGETFFTNLLMTIFRVMFALTLPGIVVWFIYIFYSIFQDKKMKEYVERGGSFN